MMKKLAVSLLLLIVTASVAWADNVPDELAGFTLGEGIDSARDRLKMETEIPLRFSPYLKEIETVDIPGFKYGLIWVATCETPGRIARIKMKYHDPSEEFFDEVLKRLKKRFGKPDEWRGDPFHVVSAWKWSFLDAKGNDISMYLEHNTSDQSESKGNSLKLTLWSLVESEKNCFDKQASAAASPAADAPAAPPWDLMIPE